MSLLTVIQKSIAVADKITQPLQATVEHTAWVSADSYGSSVYAAAVERKALIDQRQQRRRTTSGEVISVASRLTFLKPIEEHGADGRTEPIDRRDVFTLPDGTTGPVVDVEGFTDAETGHPLVTDVWLGFANR